MSEREKHLKRVAKDREEGLDGLLAAFEGRNKRRLREEQDEPA